MNYYGNMGPFDPVSLKGNARINAVPVFVDKLPLTLGGIAGEDVKFGRVVSIEPVGGRRMFKMGIPSTTSVVKGIAMYDPSIARTDPAMQDFYFAGRPMTVTTFGILDILEYDLSQSAPFEGATVWARNADGVLAFNDGTDISASGYTQLNATVYETLDPNGAKVFFGTPFVVSQTKETLTAAVTPAPSTAAGAVASGTQITLSSTTPASTIYYTLDGTTPTMESIVYNGPITITSAVTITAIAVAEGMNPSTALSAAYTIV